MARTDHHPARSFCRVLAVVLLPLATAENLLSSFVPHDANASCAAMYRRFPGLVTGCGFDSMPAEARRAWLAHECGRAMRSVAEREAVDAARAARDPRSGLEAALRVYAGPCETVIDERAPVGRGARFVHFGVPSAQRRAAVTPVSEWKPWVCDGTVAIDVGAAWGDTSVSMAVAAGASGAVVSLEMVPQLHHQCVANALANRDVARLLPVNVAVVAASDAAPGGAAAKHAHHHAARGRQRGGRRLLAARVLTTRFVRVWPWFARAFTDLAPSVSFVKIDVDALSAFTGATLLDDLAQAAAAWRADGRRPPPPRPALKVEWFGGDRKLGCVAKTQRLFDAARAAGYTVFAADAMTRLASCDAALSMARAHDGAGFPKGGGSKFADFYLLPDGVSAATRNQSCPPALPGDAHLPDLPIGRGDPPPV